MSHRLSRKEIKRDEFLESVGEAFDYIRGHSRALLLGAAGVVLLVVLGAVYYAWRQGREAEADRALARA